MQDQNSTILAAVQEYISKCPLLKSLDMHIDQTEDEPVNYSLSSSGQILLNIDILGNETWQYNVLLQSREYTADDYARLDNAAFTEQFIFYLQSCNKDGLYPALPDKCTAKEIYADNGILLYLDDNGDRGLYQIQIHLIFEREVF